MSGSPNDSAVGLCVNHPTVAAQTTCSSCSQPFCSSCLVTFQGQPHCGPCRDRLLVELEHGRPEADGRLIGTSVVDMGGWLRGGWELVRDDLMNFGLAALILLAVVGTCPLLLGPLYCGYYVMAFHKIRYGRTELGHLFALFRRPVPSLVAGLIVTVFIYAMLAVEFAPLIGALLTGQGLAAALMAMLVASSVLSVIATIAGVALGGATFFWFARLAATDESALEAFRANWEVVRRSFLMYCLAGFVFQIVGNIGMLACYVGVFLTMPIMMAAEAKAYADHFGIEGFDQI